MSCCKCRKHIGQIVRIKYGVENIEKALREVSDILKPLKGLDATQTQKYLRESRIGGKVLGGLNTVYASLLYFDGELKDGTERKLVDIIVGANRTNVLAQELIRFLGLLFRVLVGSQCGVTQQMLRANVFYDAFWGGGTAQVQEFKSETSGKSLCSSWGKVSHLFSIALVFPAYTNEQIDHDREALDIRLGDEGLEYDS